MNEWMNGGNSADASSSSSSSSSRFPSASTTSALTLFMLIHPSSCQYLQVSTLKSLKVLSHFKVISHSLQDSTPKSFKAGLQALCVKCVGPSLSLMSTISHYASFSLSLRWDVSFLGASDLPEETIMRQSFWAESQFTVCILFLLWFAFETGCDSYLCALMPLSWRLYYYTHSRVFLSSRCLTNNHTFCSVCNVFPCLSISLTCLICFLYNLWNVSYGGSAVTFFIYL